MFTIAAVVVKQNDNLVDIACKKNALNLPMEKFRKWMKHNKDQEWKDLELNFTKFTMDNYEEQGWISLRMI